MPSKEFNGTVVGKNPKSYSRGRPYGDCIWIVIHTTEGSEHARSAEDGNAYDARRTDGTSTHVFVDTDTVVQEVNSGDRAHAALAVGNNRGYQIELCGRAAQSASQWSDASSSAELLLAAQHCARVAIKLGIPVRWLTKEQVLAREKGFVTHKNITDWVAGTHTDPGTNFPFGAFSTMVRRYVREYTTIKPPEVKPTPQPDLTGSTMKLFMVKDQPAKGKEARYKTDGLKAWHIRTMSEVRDLEKLFGATVTLSAWPESVSMDTDGGLRAMNGDSPIEIDDTQYDSEELRDGEHNPNA